MSGLNAPKVISSDLIPNLFSIDQKVVVIVGIGGLGAGIAKGFAHNGARLALVNRTLAKAEALAEEIMAEGFEARSYELDVKDENACNSITDTIEKDFGRIDVLIFTSAIAPFADPYSPDMDDLRECMEVNFLGGVYLNKAMIKVMAKNGFGRIININSGDGLAVSCSDGMHYACSKAALQAATRAFAVNYGDKNITVNGIAPTWIWTPMMTRRPASYMEEAARQIPVGRCSWPEDYLGILFFLSSEASSFVNGQLIMVDGGQSVNRIVDRSKEH